MSDVSLAVIIFREGEQWIAQCLQRDICAQGDTEDDALQSLRRTIDAELQLRPNADFAPLPLEWIPEAPRECWERFRACSFPTNKVVGRKTDFFYSDNIGVWLSIRIERT